MQTKQLVLSSAYFARGIPVFVGPFCGLKVRWESLRVEPTTIYTEEHGMAMHCA